jgi:hypothetical protein
MHRKFLLFILVGTSLVIVGCSQVKQANTATKISDQTPTPSLPSPSATSTAIYTPSLTSTPTITFTPSNTPTATPDMRPNPDPWANWSIVPTLSARAQEIYRNGMKLGNTPFTFSSVGDCQSEPDVFMGVFVEDWYNPQTMLPNDPTLWTTIDLYRDSFKHSSASVRDGLSAPSALDPLWADPERCQPSESPIACELRIYKPSIIFINLGTNWRADASTAVYENYLRQIVDIVIANGTIPVLSTKADNIEGDWSINRRTVRIAYDYDIPLFNFWLAAQFLPNAGLDASRDNIYMTTAAWDLRNYYALKTLDMIRQAVEQIR